MNAKQIVERRFISPLMGRQKGNIGVELEFPMLNLQKEPVAFSVANGLLEHLLENGFHLEEETTDGYPAFIVNKDGDCISYDNSYNNLEFAMHYGQDLTAIASRFEKLWEQCQAYLVKHRHLLTGLGTNPYKAYITQSHVSYPVYNMVDDYLHSCKRKNLHPYPDFPAYLSSAQTHLDVEPALMPRAATLFARLDFVRAQLFSNALPFEGNDCLCFRDVLWEKSGFPNTGKVDETYKTLDDLAGSYLTRAMFNRIRNGRYEYFKPVPLQEYFEDPRYGAKEQDIKQFLSFRNIEVTARGTLEVRSDCQQPRNATFAPAAFSLGLLYNLEQAEILLKTYLKSQGIRSKTKTLRNDIIFRRSSLDKTAFSLFLQQLLDVAADGLRRRAKGEQTLLLPLYGRAAKLQCPAQEHLSLLEKGASWEELIQWCS